MRLEKTVKKKKKKKKKKKAGYIVGKPLENVRTLHEKRLYRKLILNDPTHPVRHYFDRHCFVFVLGSKNLPLLLLQQEWKIFTLQQEWKIFTPENKYKPL